MTRKLMRIGAIGVDKKSGMPLVILHDPAGKLIMPIWVGYNEANAMSMAASKTQSPRPSTYELFLSTLKELNARIECVSIEASNEGKFQAWINLEGGIGQSNGEPVSLEARPADAIVLASLSDAPLFVSSDIFDAVEAEEAAARELNVEDEEKERQKFKDFLEDLKPSDFEKYSSKE
ncbi:MAG TPA: bifunctional nuclease family protein [Candidatus Melainabacteria bacterium]|nr:bifunctional nuclease family protein [Candidatus Melainabacteria bacterium]